MNMASDRNNRIIEDSPIDYEIKFKSKLTTREMLQSHGIYKVKTMKRTKSHYPLQETATGLSIIENVLFPASNSAITPRGIVILLLTCPIGRP